MLRPRRFASPRSERTVKSLGILKFNLLRYTRNKLRNQTGSGLIHPIVKEQVLPGRLEEQQTIFNYTNRTMNVKRVFRNILALVEISSERRASDNLEAPATRLVGGPPRLAALGSTRADCFRHGEIPPTFVLRIM